MLSIVVILNVLKNIERTIIDLYNGGANTASIAKKLNITPRKILRVLNKNNIPIRSIKTPKEVENQIISMYKSGKSSSLIAKDLNLHSTTVCKILKRNNCNIRSGSENKRKYNVNDSFLDEIDSEEKAYFLGFMFADGTVHKNRNTIMITLHKKDIKILERFRDLIVPDAPLYAAKDKYVMFFVASKKLKNRLIKLGCGPNKTFKTRLPNIHTHLMRHFIRGVYDGDGCLSLSANRPRIILTGNYDFVSDIKNVLYAARDITGSLIISKKNNKSGDFYVSSAENVKKLVNYLYKDSTIYLDRKKDMSNKLVEKCNGMIGNTVSIMDYDLPLDSNGDIHVSRQYIEQLNLAEKNHLADKLIKHFREVGFPYDNYSDDDLNYDFKQLVDIKLDNIETKSMVGMKVVKHFCPHYYSVRSKKLPSMVDAFEDDELLLKVINNRLGITYKETFNITNSMLKQGFRNSYTAFGASVFKPAVAKYIYSKYAPKDSMVLDVSAGFGQRMLGAYASGNVIKYVGLDPWVETHKALTKMKDFFGFNAELYDVGSQSFYFKLLDSKFDFCFSSPPFYNKEIYNDEPTQAYAGRTLDQFVDDWWKPTAENVYKMLKPGSLFILNMNERVADIMIKGTKDLFEFVDNSQIVYNRPHLSGASKDNFFVLKSKR